MNWTIGLLTVITLTLTWSQLMTISAAQQKLQQSEQSTSGVLESLTSSQASPSDVGGTASSTAGSSTTATAKTNPTITTTGTPTASDAKAQQQQPSPTPGSLASSLLSGMILLLSHYLLNSFHQLNLRGSNWSRTPCGFHFIQPRASHFVIQTFAVRSVSLFSPMGPTNGYNSSHPRGKNINTHPIEIGTAEFWVSLFHTTEFSSTIFWKIEHGKKLTE